jgi:hypothetical protein
MSITSIFNDLTPLDRTTLDILSIGTVVATMANILPAFAAILTIIWTGIRIYETATVQSILGKRDNGKSPDSE